MTLSILILFTSKFSILYPYIIIGKVICSDFMFIYLIIPLIFNLYVRLCHEMVMNAFVLLDILSSNSKY